MNMLNSLPGALNPFNFISTLCMLPLLFLLLIILGVFLFYYGKGFMVEPKHSVWIAIQAFDALAKKQRRIEGTYRRNLGRGEAQGKEAVSAETGSADLPVEDREAGLANMPGTRAQDLAGRHPVHDAPLWILAYLLVLAGYLALLAIDTAGVQWGKDPKWLEMLILGHIPVIRHLVPFSDALAAMIFYLIVGYLLVLFLGSKLSGWLQTSQLYHFERYHFGWRLASALWRACGFIDFRKLDKACAIWAVRPLLFLSVLLVLTDLLGFLAHVKVLPGGLAMAHLFFVAVVRMFDETWLYPVKFEQHTRPVLFKTPLEELAEAIYRKGALPNSASPSLLFKMDPEEKDPTAPRPHLSPITRDFLETLTGSDELREHQAMAWERIFTAGSGVVLSGPEGSGKSTWARLVAVNEIIYNAGGVLIILPDRASLKREVAFLRRAVMTSSARWNLTVFDASVPEFLSIDVAKHPPLLVLADTDTLENVLLRHWNIFGSLWRQLSRVIVEDMGSLAGVQTSNFYFLLRRLMANRDAVNSRKLSLCGTCSRSSRLVEDEIEKLLGSPMEFITEKPDPSRTLLVYGIACGANEDSLVNLMEEAKPSRDGMDGYLSFARPASVATALATAIRQEGHAVYLDPRIASRHEMERRYATSSWQPMAGHQFDALAASASIVYVDQENLLTVMDDIRRFGMQSKDDIHVCFLLLSHNPMVQHMLLHCDRLAAAPGERTLGNLFFNAENTFLIERHMEAALDNMPMDQAKLRGIFGKHLTDRKIADMIRDERIEIIEQPDHPYAGCFLLMNRRFSQNLSTSTVTDDQLEVIYPARNRSALLFKGEASYVRTEFYPGRIFMWEGERYMVRRSLTERRTTDSIEVQAHEDLVITSKIRSVSIEVSAADLAARSIRTTVPGGRPLHMARVPAVVTENILGCRKWGADLTHLADVFYSKQKSAREISVSVKNDVLFVIFEAEADPDVLRLLEELLRAVIPVFFPGKLDAPDVFVPETAGCKIPFGGCCVCLRELYPGGVGVLACHDDVQVLRYLNLCREMLRELPDLGMLLRPFSYGKDLPIYGNEVMERAVDFINLVIPETGVMPEDEAFSDTLGHDGRDDAIPPPETAGFSPEIEKAIARAIQLRAQLEVMLEEKSVASA